MSLLGDVLENASSSFPRVSGDEPCEGSSYRWNFEFSPRERG